MEHKMPVNCMPIFAGSNPDNDTVTQQPWASYSDIYV